MLDLVTPFITKEAKLQFLGLIKKILKRIVGVPGDTIIFNKNNILLKNQDYYYNLELRKHSAMKIRNNILRETKFDKKFLFGKTGVKIIIPNDYFFLLGDNAKMSIDSRHFGLVCRDNFIGKVIMVIFPPFIL